VPLYTYIASYRCDTYIGQDRRSNFKGFAPSMLEEMSDNAMPGMTMAMRTELSNKLYRSEWLPVANRINVWRTAFDLGGAVFELHAVQTDA
jgi:hypothetical protein